MGTFSHLLYQISSHAVPVEVRVSVFVAKETEVFGVELNIVEYVFADIIR